MNVDLSVYIITTTYILFFNRCLRIKTKGNEELAPICLSDTEDTSAG